MYHTIIHVAFIFSLFDLKNTGKIVSRKNCKKIMLTLSCLIEEKKKDKNWKWLKIKGFFLLTFKLQDIKHVKDWFKCYYIMLMFLLSRRIKKHLNRWNLFQDQNRTDHDVQNVFLIIWNAFNDFLELLWLGIHTTQY